MKKILFIISIMLLMVGCTKETDFMTTGGPQTEVYVNGMPATSNSNTKSSPKSGSLLTYERMSAYHWTEPFDMFDKFPEFITPEGYYDDFLFTSNGNPFTLVMLYANGGYRHDLGIYWYDNDNVYHEQELWVEVDDIANGSWINYNGSSSGGVISRVNDNAGAYTITLPAGTKYGFYCHSTLNGEEVLEGIRTPLPFGPVVAYNYKFYTEKTKNWSYMVAEYDHYAEQGKTTTQAMTTNTNGWSIVGFEDRSITHPGCDRDYNDCVFAMYPQQSMYNPSAPAVGGNVEVDIHQQEHTDWGEIKTSIHIRCVSDVTVNLPIEEMNYIAPADDVDVRSYVVRCEYLTSTVSGLNVTVYHAEPNTTISVTGITQEMLDEFNGELTIEVHSYYNIISDLMLWGKLQNSSVTLTNPLADLTGQIHYKNEPKENWITLN